MYNGDLRSMIGHHIDGITNPSHPLFGHPLTNQLGSLAANNDIHPSQLKDALAPHFDAMGDPSHPLATHPLTQIFQGIGNPTVMPMAQNPQASTGMTMQPPITSPMSGTPAPGFLGDQGGPGPGTLNLAGALRNMNPGAAGGGGGMNSNGGAPSLASIGNALGRTRGPM